MSADDAAEFCTGCGEPIDVCVGCKGELEPTRFCPQCGRRLAVLVTPTGWRGRCRDHGEVANG